MFFNESLGLFGIMFFFSLKVLFFLASGILRDSAVPFFRMDLWLFGDQHCFFNESLGLFGLRFFLSMTVLVFLASSNL